MSNEEVKVVVVDGKYFIKCPRCQRDLKAVIDSYGTLQIKNPCRHSFSVEERVIKDVVAIFN